VSVRFGDCVLATDRRELLRGGQPVPLTGKAYQLLELLLEKRPKAVSKAEIHERLWPATFVSEVNLATLVFEIRRAIGDKARRPQFLRTVRGFGYAFCDEESVEEPKAPSAAVVCRLFWGDREVSLDAGENILGRDPDAAVWIDSNTVSRHHARIVVTDQGATLEDLASKNGTFLKGLRLDAPAKIEDRDEFLLGSVRIRFRAVPRPSSTATTPSGSST
jgi:DNA-binding winged helix-turn-helix (wHTH) protein